MKDVFYTDISFTNQYYGVLVRSPIERGNLIDIRPPPLPDGYYLYSATDIPGENRLTAMGTSIPVFTPREIQYLGEPLGVIVGPDLNTVVSLVKEVYIETETLETWKFGEKFSSSQIAAKRIMEKGEPDAAFESGDTIHESRAAIGPYDHHYAEPMGASVYVSRDSLEIHTATQWPDHVRATVSAVLDLDPEEIKVRATALGECLDGKIWFPSLIAAQASLAAVLCKHPVKIVFTRQEDFLFTVKSAPIEMRYRSVLSPDGRIRAMLVRVLINSGSYSPLIDEIAERITKVASGLYDIESWRVETWALRTNMPPMGALSGWGESQILFALETHLSMIASALNESPTEFRLRNLGSLASTHENLFQRVRQAVDFDRKYASYELLAKARLLSQNGYLRGIGFAFGFQGNGFTATNNPRIQYTVEAVMDTEGLLKFRMGKISENLQKVFRSVAASTLGIEEHLVHFDFAHRNVIAINGPDTLSVGISILLPLVTKCCEAIARQRFRKPLPLSVKKSWKQAEKKEGSDAAESFTSVTPGACALELELDRQTGACHIRALCLACDAGRLHDRAAALHAIRKAIPASISRVLGERIAIVDGTYRSKEGTLYDILPPSLSPECKVDILETSETAKGIGTIAGNLIPAAFASALYQITRAHAFTIPYERQVVQEALQ